MIESVERFRSRHILLSADMESRNALRQQILDVALEIAASEGVRGASLRRISARVGMRTATLYSYFPEGKDQLVSSAISSLLVAFYHNAALGLRPDDTSLENLRSLVFRHIRWNFDRTKTVPAWEVVISADRITPVLSDTLRQEFQELSASYRTLIRDLLEDLGIAESSRAPLAEMIIVICDGVYKWGPTNPSLSGVLEAEEFAWLSVRRLLFSNSSAAHEDALSNALNKPS